MPARPEPHKSGLLRLICNLFLQVMKVVNDLIKVPELNQTMQQMSREMMKAGLIEETMGEMMDDALDTDDIEEDADAEVDKVSMPAALAQRVLRWLSSVYLCVFCGGGFNLSSRR